MQASSTTFKELRGHHSKVKEKVGQTENEYLLLDHQRTEPAVQNTA